MSLRRTIAVSAPGKVLVAGGYLVLDRAYTGLVFGLDARIHVVISSAPSSQRVISVRSPQFADPSWDYSYKACTDDAGVEVIQITKEAAAAPSRNPFVETTLRYILSYITAQTGESAISPASITILADNSYYTTSAAALSGKDRFYNFKIPLSKAHKTGLGSSAALVTALTTALLRYYLPSFDVTENASQHLLHNLAQAAHCAAQGKVGSGFDVASAVFGSCIYRRFSPAVLSSLPEPGTLGFASRLQHNANDISKQWDTEIQKNMVAVPAGLRMVMCDVSCGSQTPGMVKKVLAWRQQQPDAAEKIWSELHAANLNLASELRQAAQDTSKDYSKLTACFEAIRKQIRKMGEASEVPIEPPAQTQLIDSCCEVPGVIGGTVPGAGGYDAIVLLIEDKQSVIESLNKLFTDLQFEGEQGEGKVSMLTVREEMQGVKDEDLSTYTSWL